MCVSGKSWLFRGSQVNFRGPEGYYLVLEVFQRGLRGLRALNDKLVLKLSRVIFDVKKKLVTRVTKMHEFESGLKSVRTQNLWNNRLPITISLRHRLSYGKVSPTNHILSTCAFTTQTYLELSQ